MRLRPPRGRGQPALSLGGARTSCTRPHGPEHPPNRKPPGPFPTAKYCSQARRTPRLSNSSVTSAVSTAHPPTQCTDPMRKSHGYGARVRVPPRWCLGRSPPRARGRWEDRGPWLLVPLAHSVQAEIAVPLTKSLVWSARRLRLALPPTTQGRLGLDAAVEVLGEADFVHPSPTPLPRHRPRSARPGNTRVAVHREPAHGDGDGGGGHPSTSQCASMPRLGTNRSSDLADRRSQGRRGCPRRRPARHRLGSLAASDIALTTRLDGTNHGERVEHRPGSVSRTRMSCPSRRFPRRPPRAVP